MAMRGEKKRSEEDCFVQLASLLACRLTGKKSEEITKSCRSTFPNKAHTHTNTQSSLMTSIKNIL